MILILIVEQSIPHIWCRIRVALLRLLYAVLPFLSAKLPVPSNTPADDLDSDPGFVLNCGKMSAFEREYYYLKNIML